MGGREWNISKNNGTWLCVLYLSLKAKRFWYIGVRGIDSSKALHIINCNYGQYDKSIHRLLYKNRNSNKIISLLNKVLS